MTDPRYLEVEKQCSAVGTGLAPCWEQKEPARQLPNLKGVPTLILVGEASYHAAFDHCTAKWLSQAGVKVDFVRLEDRDINGNGHMLMIEKNNLDIAKLLDDWMQENLS